MTYLNRKIIRAKRPTHSHLAKPVKQLFVDESSRKFESFGGFQIKGRKDQLENLWLFIRRDESVAALRFDVGNEAAIWKAMAKRDMLVTQQINKTGILAAVERIRHWPEEVYSVTAPGIHCGAYVKPDGSVIGKPSSEHFLVNLGTVIPLAKAGTPKGWKATIKTYVQDQPVLILPLGLSLVGPLLEFIGRDNVCLELIGPTSTGKTTALSLYASVWGAPHKKPGSLSISLRSTANGIEQHVLARNGAAFPADEGSLLGNDSKKQADNMFEIAFMVSEGVAKERWNDPAPPRASLSVMFTANTAMAQLLQHCDQEQVGALLVRWISMPTDRGPGGRKRGVIDSLPKGYSTSKEVITALNRGLALNHGHAADAFLKRLLAEINGDPAKLKAMIERLQNRFLDAIGEDPDENAVGRRADLFAIIYAATRLAAKWKVIPITGIKAALVECYRRSTPAAPIAPAKPLGAIDRVKAYVAAHKAELLDLDRIDLPLRRKPQLDKMAGFLKTAKGRRCLLIRTPRWVAEFGADSESMIQELKAQGRLLVTAKNQLQTRIRRNQPKDRVYAIALDGAAA